MALGPMVVFTIDAVPSVPSVLTTLMPSPPIAVVEPKLRPDGPWHQPSDSCSCC